MKLLLLQGANLNYLGYKKGKPYGGTTAKELDALLIEHAKKFNYQLEIFYTNIEGEAINKIYECLEKGIDGIVANPAGFTHNAYALRGCLSSIAPPYVEVHMTNIDKSKIPSITSEAAEGVVMGFGIDSYFIALEAILRLLSKK